MRSFGLLMLAHTAWSIAKIGQEAPAVIGQPVFVFSSMPFEKGTDFVEALFSWICRYKTNRRASFTSVARRLVLRWGESGWKNVSSVRSYRIAVTSA